MQDGRGRADTPHGASSEQANEIAREDVTARHSPRLVQQLSAPPAVLGRRGDSDDIPLLEIELLVDRRGIVVQRLDVEQHAFAVVQVLARWRDTRRRCGLRRRLAWIGRDSSLLNWCVLVRCRWCGCL